MNKNELITLAANSNELKGFCKKLCEGNDIYLDMFQDFLVHLLECSEEMLAKKYNDMLFIGYCYYKLRELNMMRLRAAKFTNSKNTLATKMGMIDFEDVSDEIPDETYNHNVDEKFEKTMEYLENDKSVKKYQVAILFASTQKSTREISEIIGTKERVVIYQNNKLKQKIKAHVR